jgi:hypothetical protein
MKRRTAPGRALATLLFLCIASLAFATSVRQVSIDNSLDTSEFVFHGVVTEREAFTAGAPDTILTPPGQIYFPAPAAKALARCVAPCGLLPSRTSQ